MDRVTHNANAVEGKRTAAVILPILVVGMASFCIAAGPYPEPLSNTKDIRAAKPTIDSIDIWNLPLADYPLLSKFSSLKRTPPAQSRGYVRDGRKNESARKYRLHKS